jgi:Intracellular proteinase inhibitor
MQQGVSQKIITDRTQYPPSRAVELTAYLFNDSPSLIAFAIGTRFEFELRVRESRSRRIVWNWSKNKKGPPTEVVRLQPGQWREHRELWDRRDDSGRRVPAGVYDVELIHVPFTVPVTTQIYLMDREQPGGEPRPTEPAPLEPSKRVLPPRPEGGSVQATLQVDRKSVRAGESIRFTYTLVNTHSQPTTFSFSSGCQFDLEVRRRPEPNARYAAGALTIWRLSRSRSYLMAFTRLTLAPGEKKTFTESWIVPTGLATGVYDLVGYLPIVGGVNAAEALGSLTVG